METVWNVQVGDEVPRKGSQVGRQFQEGVHWPANRAGTVDKRSGYEDVKILRTGVSPLEL